MTALTHTHTQTHTDTHTLYTPLVRGAHGLGGAGGWTDKMEAGETDHLHKGRTQTH